MKWIGQHIWDFISRFRNIVYFEDVSESPSTTSLVVDPDGKVGTNGSIGSGVDSITTTDGTYIDMTPNVPTAGALTIASDLSAVDGTSDVTTRFLSKDNTWDVPTYSVGGITESTQSGGSGFIASWSALTYVIPIKIGGNFLNSASLNVPFAQALNIDQIIASKSGEVYNMQVVLVCDNISFPEGCPPEGSNIVIGVIKDPMTNGQTQFNYTFTPIMNIPLPETTGTTSVICTPVTVAITACDAWTFAAFFDCGSEEGPALSNVYIWCTLNKHSS